MKLFPLYLPVLSLNGNNKNQGATPMLYKSDAFYFTFFCSFLILHFYDEHTWFVHRRQAAAVVPGCPLVGTAVLPTLCAWVYIFNPSTVLKKNHRVNGEFSSLQSGSPVKKDTKNIAGRCYLLKLFTKILEQNGRVGKGPRFCQHSFIFSNCHIYSCLIGMHSEATLCRMERYLMA